MVRIPKWKRGRLNFSFVTFVAMISSEFDVWQSGDIPLQICVFYYYCYHLDYGHLSSRIVQCFLFIYLFVASQYQNWPPQMDFPKDLYLVE